MKKLDKIDQVWKVYREFLLESYIQDEKDILNRPEKIVIYYEDGERGGRATVNSRAELLIELTKILNRGFCFINIENVSMKIEATQKAIDRDNDPAIFDGGESEFISHDPE